MVNSLDFSKRLQKILDFYGLSAAAFSEEIDFNRSTISHILSGRNKPSLDFVLKVVQQFPEVELYWLLNGKGSFPNNEISEFEKQSVKVVSEKTPSDILGKSISAPSASKTDSEIDKIVVFYKDGTFKSYSN